MGAADSASMVQSPVKNARRNGWRTIGAGAALMMDRDGTEENTNFIALSDSGVGALLRIARGSRKWIPLLRMGLKAGAGPA